MLHIFLPLGLIEVIYDCRLYVLTMFTIYRPAHCIYVLIKNIQVNGK